MIVFEKTSWLRILFSYHGTALQRSWRRLLFVTAVAVAITVIRSVTGFRHDLTVLPFSLVGVALGIFLGFRNNASYDRWWEGRKLWGSVVNVSRTLTRQILTLIGPLPGSEGRNTHSGADPNAQLPELAAFQREMVHRVAAYVHCLRMHLRDEGAMSEVAHLLSPDEMEELTREGNRPIAILQTLGNRVRDAWQRGWIHSMHVPMLEESLADLTDIQGGCERIKNTPIPFSYTALIHSIVAIYCFALPFGLVSAIAGFTPVVVAIISYAFFGLDAIGDEIEDPFGKEPNDLPLTSLTTMIEINLRTRIGETDLPAMPRPIDRVVV